MPARDVGRAGWKTTPSAFRVTPYPINAEPRLLRVSLINALREAWLARTPAQRDRHLAAAAYWHQEWKRKAPEEREPAHDTDVFEGTARYIEATALRHALTGRAEARKGQMAKSVFPKRTVAMALDGESYDAGGLAGLILAELRMDGWRQQVISNDQSPIDVLLNDIVPRAQRPDPATAKKRVKEQSAKNQQEAAGAVDPLLTAYNNSKNAQLRIPESSFQGSYEPGSSTCAPVRGRARSTPSWRRPPR